MIKQITRAYIRTYADNGQVTAYVEWVDSKGKPGRTEGNQHDTKSAYPCVQCGKGGPCEHGNPAFYEPHFGVHMQALLNRAERESVSIEREQW